jgi:hypothetical protein
MKKSLGGYCETGFTLDEIKAMDSVSLNYVASINRTSYNFFHFHSKDEKIELIGLPLDSKRRAELVNEKTAVMDAKLNANSGRLRAAGVARKARVNVVKEKFYESIYATRRDEKTGTIDLTGLPKKDVIGFGQWEKAQKVKAIEVPVKSAKKSAKSAAPAK